MRERWLQGLALGMVTILMMTGCSGDGATTENPATDPPADDDAGTEPADEEPIELGFSISSFQHDFLVTLAESVEAASTAAGADVTVVDAGGDAATQTSQMEDLVTSQVDVILLNPVDAEAIVPAVETANAAGIPVITVDRGASGGDIVSFIASDNVLGGQMAGEFLFEAIGGSGDVIELEGISGTSAARDRGEGFQLALDDAPEGISRVAEQTANFSREEGLSVTENLLQVHPDAAGLFAHNDDMALGAIEAVAAAGRDDLVIVGFDAAPDALQAIKDGTMTATIAQLPTEMGQLAVETAIKVANGESVEAEIGVDVALVTADNVDDFG